MYEIYERLLNEKGVKTSQVCKATGIPQSTFSDWKKGKSKPKTEKLQKIADYFDVSIDYLTGKSEYRHPYEEFDAKYDTNQLREELEQIEQYDSDLKRIERARSKMTPKDKEKMMRVLEASFDEYFDD